VKEMYSYVCPDLAKEFQKFDQKPDKYFKTYQGIKVGLNLNILFVGYVVKSLVL
jgi:hypothetical protein